METHFTSPLCHSCVPINDCLCRQYELHTSIHLSHPYVLLNSHLCICLATINLLMCPSLFQAAESLQRKVIHEKVTHSSVMTGLADIVVTHKVHMHDRAREPIFNNVRNCIQCCSPNALVILTSPKGYSMHN